MFTFAMNLAVLSSISNAYFIQVLLVERDTLSWGYDTYDKLVLSGDGAYRA